MKQICITILFVLFTFSVVAQDGKVMITPIYDEGYVEQNLCGSLVNLASDAVKGFTKAKGKEVETIGNVTMWTSNVGLPGVITSSLLFSGVWQYEGVIAQNTSADDLSAVYKRYRTLLRNCLSDKGYDEVATKNTADGLEQYPELIYKKPSGAAAPVSLKIDKASTTGIYVLTLNVWQSR